LPTVNKAFGVPGVLNVPAAFTMTIRTTTVVERKGASIVYRADQTYEIPNLDLLTLLFGKYVLYE
jgi:hypothetical protein